MVNTGGEDGGKGIENPEQDKLKKDNLKSKFIKKFTDPKLNDPSKKIAFLDDVMKRDSLGGSDIQRDMKAFYEILDKTEKGFNIEEINILDLKRKVSGPYTLLKNQRETFTDILKKEYNITSQDDKKIALKIGALTEKELKELISGEREERKNFLKLCFGKNKLPTSKELLTLFKKTDFSERIKKKLETLGEDEKKEFKNIIQRFEIGDISSVDLLDFFHYSIFTLEEKKELIHNFLPYITLEEALGIGVISQSESNDLKKVRVETINIEMELGLSEKEIINITNNLFDREIQISTKLITGDVEARLDIIGKNICLKNIDSYIEEEKLQKIENKNSINTFDDFIEALSKNKLVSSNVKSKFIPGNILVLSEVNTEYGIDQNGRKKSENTSHKRFLKIENDGSETGKIKFKLRGDDEYDDSMVDSYEMDYNTFLAFLKNGGIKNDEYGNVKTEFKVIGFNIYTKAELEKEIIKNTLTATKDKLIVSDVVALEKELDEYTKNLRTTFEAEGKRKTEIDALIEKDPEYKKLKEALETNNEINNEQLRKKIDEIDHDGHGFGLDKGTAFQTRKGSIYTITGIEGGEISLDSLAGKESKISYQSFYTTFKSEGAKRTSNAKNFNELMNLASGDKDIESSWKQYDFNSSNGTLEKKEGADKNITYPYLASMDSEELIKIISINGGEVRIQVGDIKTKKEKDKDGKDKKIGDIFGIDESKTFTVTTAWLHTYIKKHKLIPRSFDEKKDLKEDEINTVDRKFSLSSWLFSKSSVAEILAGFKLGFESVEHYLKEGNDQHAAHFAEGVFGKFLPESIQRDLKARVEQTEKKHQDEYVDKLKAVDSNVASSMIISWLKNKNSPEHKKEAGLVFMMEKYGVLYAKDLAPYKGRFLFYEALGGKVGDELFNEIKSQSEATDLPFSEEYLVYILLVRQCKGKLSPHRRTRLHKEFKKMRATGKKEEMETGRGDAADERTIGARVAGGIDELTGGTYPNAVGWMEEAVKKGGTMKEMSKISFVMAFSGVAYGFDRIQILDAIKNFNAKGYLIPITRFMSYTSDLNILNNTILELSKRLEARTGGASGKYGGMTSSAQKIFDNMKSTDKSDPEKIKETVAFYEKYGDVLIRSLYMLNDGGQDDESHLTKLIFLEKDDGYLDENKKEMNGNSTFKKYYDYLRMYVDADADFTNKDTMTDPFKKKGTSAFHVSKATKNIELAQGGGFRNHGVGSVMWEELYNEFHAIIKRDYNTFGEESKKKILTDMLRQFLAALLEMHSTNPNLLSALSSNISTIGSTLISWGIDMVDLARKVDSYMDLEHGTSVLGNKMIDGYVKNMLSGKNMSGQVGNRSFSDINVVMGDVKTATNSNLEREGWEE